MEVWETWLLMCLLLRCMLLRRNLLLILLLRVWLVLLTVALMLISSLKTQTSHDEVHLLLHHAECSLPVWRVLVLRRVLRCITVLVVIIAAVPSAVAKLTKVELMAVALNVILLWVVALGDFGLGTGAA